jgi:tRNA A37 threonylcarbamoyladenosine synthetase subunit TsaC/SUA5/YrdC
VSSANLTGEPAAVTCAQAEQYLGAKVKVYLDGGASPKGESSTILDLTALTPEDESNPESAKGKIRVVRKGALSVAKIRSVVGDLLEAQA